MKKISKEIKVSMMLAAEMADINVQTSRRGLILIADKKRFGEFVSCLRLVSNPQKPQTV
jgi:hypothetical protein